ncbi:GSCOCG00006355001-RA-CDS [Cotesia congregata]|nr:GSCOCG00006355001-RA-CDS [Cotesia congregata]
MIWHCFLFVSETIGATEKKKKMARGHQKIQSQAKAAEKSAKMKKQQGHSANEQKKAAQKALVHVCVVCKAQMPDPKTYKQHFENKHPKNDMPDDLKNI